MDDNNINNNMGLKNSKQDKEKYLNAEEIKFIGEYKAYVFDCYDGDTFTCSIKYKDIYIKLRTRLNGCDAFEIRVPKTYKERPIKNREELIKKGIVARDRLNDLIKGKYITLECNETDKYGRLLASIIEIEGIKINVSEIMINEGHAFVYDGTGEKEQCSYYVI